MSDRPITDEDLDLLRAGLLDHRPELKKQLESEADGRFWATVIRRLDEHCANAVRVNNQLRLQRRRVLTGTGSRKLPYRVKVLTTMAGFALAAGTTYFLFADRDDPAIQLAATSAQELPDVADNVDFYVWLAAQRNSP